MNVTIAPDILTVAQADAVIRTALLALPHLERTPTTMGRAHVTLAELYATRARLWSAWMDEMGEDVPPLVRRAAFSARDADKRSQAKHLNLADYWNAGGPR